MELPEFLHLPDDAIEREKSRQQRLRQEFGSRAKQTPAEMEAARALLVEDSLRQALSDEPGNERVANQLAENLSQQGRLLEALIFAADENLREFYEKASAALTRPECACAPKIKLIDRHRVKLPKYRVIKEIYSIPAGRFGFLAECGRCEEWFFLRHNPLPPSEPANDLQRLKI